MNIPKEWLKKSGSKTLKERLDPKFRIAQIEESLLTGSINIEAIKELLQQGIISSPEDIFTPRLFILRKPL